MSADWSAARARVHLDPAVTMLNTGSFGPTPMPVFDRAMETVLASEEHQAARKAWLERIAQRAAEREARKPSP